MAFVVSFDGTWVFIPQAVSTWKLVTMVVTGIEYDDDLLYGGGSNFYVTITYIFFLGSIVLIGMVLLNFLIGIAVSDVQVCTTLLLVFIAYFCAPLQSVVELT